MKNREKTKIRISFLPAILLCVAFAFLLLLYAPLSIYLLNVDEFSYDIYDLLKMMAPIFGQILVVLVIFFFIQWLFGKKFYLFWLALFFIAYLATYVQGTFFSGNLPPMSGDAIDWSLYDYQRVFSIIIWVVISAAVIYCLVKFKSVKLVSYTCAFVTLMLILSLLISGLGGGFRNKNDYIATYGGINELSEGNNLIILVLDAVDADKYQELKATHPEYQDVFEDFTYYSNTMGAYPYTSRSIPFIITGQWYENAESFYSYTNKAYSTFNLLDELHEKNYKINIYEAELALSEDVMRQFDNTSGGDNLGFLYPLGFYKVQAKLVGYRYFPYDLKKYCEQSPAKISNSTQHGISGAQWFDASNITFYNDVCTSDYTICSQPVYSFIHLYGAHSPYSLSADLDEIDDSNYTCSVEACFNITDRFLSNLKRTGLYDNTAIIILADHGLNENVPLNSDDPTGRQNPILFVKGINEHHKYIESAAPISFDDLQSAYSSLINGATGADVFNIDEDAVRERRYLRYNLYDFTLHESIQYGNAADTETLIDTGVIFKE